MSDIYETVTNSILSAIESGRALPWRKNWSSVGFNPTRANGESYSGINVLTLVCIAATRGYGLNQWLTYKQAYELGGQVRKGEKGAPVIKYGTAPIDKNDESKGFRGYIKGYSVFNVQQIDGLPDSFYQTNAPKMINPDTRDTHIDAVFKNTGANIIERESNGAFYNYSLDHIVMPRFEQFESANGFYSVLAHELTHWTGHKTRLNRELSADRKKYAFEELVAELGACFTCSKLGIRPDIDASAAYIDSWLLALKHDKRFIFSAASLAQTASQYILKQESCAETIAA